MLKVLCCALLALVSGIAAAQSQAGFTHTLYLIRHGAYVADRNADPQLGPGITSLAIAQARLNPPRLKGSGFAFDSMTSSTMQRARDTAAVMHETFATVPLAQSPLLRECTPPLFEAAEGEVASEQAACAKQLDQAFAEFFTPARNAN